MVNLDKLYKKVIKEIIYAIIRVALIVLYWILIYELIELFQIYIIGGKYLGSEFWNTYRTYVSISIFNIMFDKYIFNKSANDNKIFTKPGLFLVLFLSILQVVYVFYDYIKL